MLKDPVIKIKKKKKSVLIKLFFVHKKFNYS